jgi:beta-galactosidase
LGESSKISGVVYMARQDGSRNGAVKDFTIEISTDGKTYREVTAGQFDLSKKPQTKTFAAINSRFIRVICHSDYSEQGFAAISEIGFLRADKASK